MARFPSEYPSCERIVAPDGTYDETAVEELALSESDLRSMYESMILARALEERGQLLQRQGRFHFWMECRGLEAAHVGPAAALDESDWMNTEWRQYGAQIQRGRPLVDILLFWLRGYETWENETIDEMPAYERRLPHIVAVGTQIPQSVGLMWGRKYQEADEAGLVAFGDGGANKGDFHAGLNMAGVLEIPIVFLLLNNQWAISTPVERQTAADTYASRAQGYGFDGVLVDGNDILATYRETKRALDHARDEHEPTLIEALTYRRGAHSSSDDPSRYRDEEDAEAWRERDPIDRFESVLEDRGLWTPAYADEVREAAETQVGEAADTALEKAKTQTPGEVFDEVYADPPPYIEAQRQELEALLEEHGETAFHGW